MRRNVKRQTRLERENAKLREKLEEAEATLRAIRNGEVDAVVKYTDQGNQIFTLEGAEKPYRILVEKMYEGAATLSQDGTILYANECLARMLRAPLEAVIGMSMRRFIEPEKRKDFELFLEKGMTGSDRREFYLVTANGGVIPTYLSISAVEIEGEHAVCLLATDLREQKLLEESRKEVEIQNMERVLRDQFISGLSHDLLNPLAAARMAAELSLKASGPEMRQQLAKKTIDGIDRVGRMIRDFLDASRIKVGAPIPLSLTEFDLKELLVKIVSESKSVHGDRFILQGAVPTRGFWDADALLRAIENLTTNAVKYGAQNSPVVIALEQPEQDAEWVRISVHSEGNPIPPSVKATLFSEFSTMKIAKSGQRGWGIGLMLVRGVAEAHGGTVTVESDSKRGTTFTIEIPRDARAFQNQAACA